MEEIEIAFSVIMPTYNSEATIEDALRSIRKQNFLQDKIEILVIDGGSTDRTREIAMGYGAIILDNPDRFPEYAKKIGFIQARGQYIIMQDSDEELIDTEQYRKRWEFLMSNPEVTCMLADQLLPDKSCGVSCSYLNRFGDPLSYFVYRSCGSILDENRKHLYKTTQKGNIYQYSHGDVIPIGDGGTTTVNIVKAKELFGEDIVYNQVFACEIFSRMVFANGLVGCIKNDNILHHSTATFVSFLKKLRYRAVVNLNHDESAGFASRERYSRELSRRKYLFVAYSASIVLPILDSVRLCIKYHDITYILHFVYIDYLIVIVLTELIKKMLGRTSKNIAYGK